MDDEDATERAGLGLRAVVAIERIRDDFELRDSGVEQAIESVAVADVPISMMMALDTSESVSGRTLQELKAGVGAAVQSLASADRASLISFSTDVRLVDRAGWHPLEVTLKTTRGKVTARRGYVR